MILVAGAAKNLARPADLRLARVICGERFPDVEVNLCLAWLDGRVDRVE